MTKQGIEHRGKAGEPYIGRADLLTGKSRGNREGKGAPCSGQRPARPLHEEGEGTDTWSRLVSERGKEGKDGALGWGIGPRETGPSAGQGKKREGKFGWASPAKNKWRGMFSPFFCFVFFYIKAISNSFQNPF